MLKWLAVRLANRWFGDILHHPITLTNIVSVTTRGIELVDVWLCPVALGDRLPRGVVCSSARIGRIRCEFQPWNLLETPLIVSCDGITVICHSYESLHPSDSITPHHGSFAAFAPGNDNDNESKTEEPPTRGTGNGNDVGSLGEEMVGGTPSYTARLWSVVMQNIQLSLTGIDLRIEPPPVVPPSTSSSSSASLASPTTSPSSSSRTSFGKEDITSSPRPARHQRRSTHRLCASVTIARLDSHRLAAIDTMGNAANDLPFSVVPSLERQFIGHDISLTIGNNRNTTMGIHKPPVRVMTINEVSLALRIHQPHQEQLSLACPRLQVNAKLAVPRVDINLSQAAIFDDIHATLSPFFVTPMNAPSTSSTSLQAPLPLPPMHMIRNRFPLLRVFRPTVRPFESPDAWWRYAHRAISWGMYHDYTAPPGPEALPHSSPWCSLYGSWLKMVMIPSKGAFCSDWWPGGNPPACLLAIAPLPSLTLNISMRHLTLSLHDSRVSPTATAATGSSFPPSSASAAPSTSTSTAAPPSSSPTSSMPPLLRFSMQRLQLNAQRATPERLHAVYPSHQSATEEADRLLWQLSCGDVRVVEPQAQATIVAIGPLPRHDAKSSTHQSSSRRRRAHAAAASASSTTGYSRQHLMTADHLRLRCTADGIVMEMGAIDAHINHTMVDTVAAFAVTWLKRKRVRFYASTPSSSSFGDGLTALANASLPPLSWTSSGSGSLRGDLHQVLLLSLQRIELTCVGAVIVVSGSTAAKSSTPASVPWHSVAIAEAVALRAAAEAKMKIMDDHSKSTSDMNSSSNDDLKVVRPLVSSHSTSSLGKTKSSSDGDDDDRMPLLPVTTSAMQLRLGRLTFRRGGFFLPDLPDPTHIRRPSSSGGHTNPTGTSNDDPSSYPPQVGACLLQVRATLEVVSYVFPFSALTAGHTPVIDTKDAHVLERLPVIDESDTNFRLFAHCADAADDAPSVLQIELPEIYMRMCTAMCLAINPLLRGIARSTRLESTIRASPLPFDLYITTPTFKVGWWHQLHADQLQLNSSDLKIECTDLRFVWLATNPELLSPSAMHHRTQPASMLATSLSASSLRIHANPNARSGREAFPAFIRVASPPPSTSPSPAIPTRPLSAGGTRSSASSGGTPSPHLMGRPPPHTSTPISVASMLHLTPVVTDSLLLSDERKRSGSGSGAPPIPQQHSPAATPPVPRRPALMVEVVSCGSWQLACRLTLRAIPQSAPNTPANNRHSTGSNMSQSAAPLMRWRRMVLLEFGDPLYVKLTHTTLPMLSQCFDSIVFAESVRTLRPLGSLFAGRRLPTATIDSEWALRCASIHCSLATATESIATFEWSGIEITINNDRIVGCLWNMRLLDDTTIGKLRPVVLTSHAPTIAATSGPNVTIGNTPASPLRPSSASQPQLDDDDDAPGPKPALKFDLALVAREDKEDMPTYIIRLNSVTLTYLQRFSHDLQSWFNTFAQSLTAAMDCFQLPTYAHTISSAVNQPQTWTAQSPFLPSPMAPLTSPRTALKRSPRTTEQFFLTPPSLRSSANIDGKMIASRRVETKDELPLDGDGDDDDDGTDDDNDDHDNDVVIDNDTGDNDGGELDIGQHEKEGQPATEPILDDNGEPVEGTAAHEEDEHEGGLVAGQALLVIAISDVMLVLPISSEDVTRDIRLRATRASLGVPVPAHLGLRTVFQLATGEHGMANAFFATPERTRAPTPATVPHHDHHDHDHDGHDDKQHATAADGNDQHDDGENDDQHGDENRPKPDMDGPIKDGVRWQLAHALLTSLTVSSAFQRRFVREEPHQHDADDHDDEDQNEEDEAQSKQRQRRSQTMVGEDDEPFETEEVVLFTGVSFDASARLQNTNDGIIMLLTASTISSGGSGQLNTSSNGTNGNGGDDTILTMHEMHCRFMSALWRGNLSENGVLPRRAAGILGLTAIVCELNSPLCRATFFTDAQPDTASASLMLRDSSLSFHIGDTFKRMCFTCEGILIHGNEDDGTMSLSDKFVALAPSPLPLQAGSGVNTDPTTNHGDDNGDDEEHDAAAKESSQPALVVYYSVAPSASASSMDDDQAPHPLLHIYARNPVLHLSAATNEFIQTLLPFNFMSIIPPQHRHDLAMASNHAHDINERWPTWMAAEVKLVGASILGIGLKPDHIPPVLTPDQCLATNNKDTAGATTTAGGTTSDSHGHHHIHAAPSDPSPHENWDTIFVQTSFHTSVRRVEIPASPFSTASLTGPLVQLHLNLESSHDGNDSPDGDHSPIPELEPEMVVRCTYATAQVRHIDMDTHMQAVMTAYDDALTRAAAANNGTSLSVVQRLSQLHQLAIQDHQWSHLFHVAPTPIMIDSPIPTSDPAEAPANGTMVANGGPPSLLMNTPVGIRVGKCTLEYGRTNGIVCSNLNSNASSTDALPLIQMTSITCAHGMLLGLQQLWALLPWPSCSTVTRASLERLSASCRRTSHQSLKIDPPSSQPVSTRSNQVRPPELAPVSETALLSPTEFKIELASTGSFNPDAIDPTAAAIDEKQPSATTAATTAADVTNSPPQPQHTIAPPTAAITAEPLPPLTFERPPPLSTSSSASSLPPSRLVPPTTLSSMAAASNAGGHDLLVELPTIQFVIVAPPPAASSTASHASSAAATQPCVWHPVYRFEANQLSIDIGSRSPTLGELLDEGYVHRLAVKGKLTMSAMESPTNVWDTIWDGYNVCLESPCWPLLPPLPTNTQPSSALTSPAFLVPPPTALDDEPALSAPLPTLDRGTGTIVHTNTAPSSSPPLTATAAPTPGPPPFARWSTGNALSPIQYGGPGATSAHGSAANSPSPGLGGGHVRKLSKSPVPNKPGHESSALFGKGVTKRTGKVFDRLGVSPEEMERQGMTPPQVDEAGHLKKSPASQYRLANHAPTSPSHDTSTTASASTTTTVAATSSMPLPLMPGELISPDMDNSPSISQSPTHIIGRRVPLFASNMLGNSRDEPLLHGSRASTPPPGGSSSTNSSIDKHNESLSSLPPTHHGHQPHLHIHQGSQGSIEDFRAMLPLPSLNSTPAPSAPATPVIFSPPTTARTNSASATLSVGTTPSSATAAGAVAPGNAPLFVIRPSAEQIAAAVLTRSTSKEVKASVNTPVSLLQTPISSAGNTPSSTSAAGGKRAFPALTVRTSIDSTAGGSATSSHAPTPMFPKSTPTSAVGTPIMFMHPSHQSGGNTPSTLPTIVPMPTGGTPTSSHSGSHPTSATGTPAAATSSGFASTSGSTVNSAHTTPTASNSTLAALSTTTTPALTATTSSKVQGTSIPGRVVKHVLKRLVSWPRVRQLRELPGMMLGQAGAAAAAGALVGDDDDSTSHVGNTLSVTMEETSSNVNSPVPTPVPPSSAAAATTTSTSSIVPSSSSTSIAADRPPPYHYFGKPTWPRTHRGAILRAGDANQGRQALRRILAANATAVGNDSLRHAVHTTSEHYIAHWPNGDGWLLASTRRLYLLQPYDRILEDKRGGTEDKKVSWSMLRNDVVRVESASGGRSLSIIGNEERHLVGPFLEQSTVHHICVALLRWRYKQKLSTAHVITDVPAHLLDDVCWIDQPSDDEDDNDSVIMGHDVSNAPRNNSGAGEHDSAGATPMLGSLAHQSGSYMNLSGVPQIGYLDHSELAAMIRTRGHHSRQSSGRLSVSTAQLLSAASGTETSHGRHSRRASELPHNSRVNMDSGGHIDFGGLHIPGYSFSDERPPVLTTIASGGSPAPSGNGNNGLELSPNGAPMSSHQAPMSGSSALGTVDDPAFVMSDSERVGTVLTHFHSGPIAIDVIGCRKLMSKDGHTGKSNPYVAVSYDNGTRIIKKQTRVHRGELDPIFGERFVFDVTNAPAAVTTIQPAHTEPCVRFRVYHKGMLAKHFLGQLVLSVRDLLTIAALGRAVWLPLKTHPDKRNMKVSGELGFKVDLHPASSAAAAATAEKHAALQVPIGRNVDTFEKPHSMNISGMIGGSSVGSGHDGKNESSSPSPSVRRISTAATGPTGASASSHTSPATTLQRDASATQILEHINPSAPVGGHDDHGVSPNTGPSSPNSVIRLQPSSLASPVPPTGNGGVVSPSSSMSSSDRSSKASFSRALNLGGVPSLANAAVDEARLALISDLQKRLSSLEATLVARDTELAKSKEEAKQRTIDMRAAQGEAQAARAKWHLAEQQLVHVKNQLAVRDAEYLQLQKEKKTMESQLRPALADQANLRAAVAAARATESELWKVKRLASEEKRVMVRDMEQRALDLERERQRLKQMMEASKLQAAMSDAAKKHAEQVLADERALMNARDAEADALGTRVAQNIRVKLQEHMTAVSMAEKKRMNLIREFGELSTMSFTIQQLRNRVSDDDIVIERLNTQLTASSSSNRTLLAMLIIEQQRSIAQTASFLAATIERSSSSSVVDNDPSIINGGTNDGGPVSLPTLTVPSSFSSRASSPIIRDRSRQNSYDDDHANSNAAINNNAPTSVGHDR